MWLGAGFVLFVSLLAALRLTGHRGWWALPALTPCGAGLGQLLYYAVERRRIRGGGPSLPLIVAMLAAFGAGGWTLLSVAARHGGDASGLFHTGSATPLPPGLRGATRVAADATGYDGQYYRIIAHDPLLGAGSMPYLDNPRLRWRRIGVPAMAWLLAGGQQQWIDRAYAVVEIAFVLLGAFWLGRFAEARGAHAMWGLAFLAVPAAAVSLDRMTIDLPLAALTIGIARAGSPATGGVYAMLAAAPLIRETGLLLTFGWAAIRRDPRAAACAAPALAWWWFVSRHTPADGTVWAAAFPFSGLLERIAAGTGEPETTAWLRKAAALETLATVGIVLALGLAFSLLRRRHGFVETAAILFAVFFAALGRLDIWTSAYATGRTLSPLLVLLGLLAFEPGRRMFAAPLLLVFPRIAFQLITEMRPAARALLE